MLLLFQLSSRQTSLFYTAQLLQNILLKYLCYFLESQPYIIIKGFSLNERWKMCL
jgi:hypothetical protein